MSGIIRSLMDVDLYKLTMMQAVLHRFPGASAVYAFKCRNAPAFPLGELKKDVERELDALCDLRFRSEELEYLSKLPYIKADFVDFLEGFFLRRRQVSVDVAADGGLSIVAAGPMLYSMMYEIYTMAIVQELYMRRMGFDVQIARERLDNKLKMFVRSTQDDDFQRKASFDLAEFGTRRRASREWQEEVIATMQAEIPTFLKGTSNVDLARRYGLVAVGTMAHEYMQAHQAMDSKLVDFQKAALENWVQEYRGNLGIALTDTIGMDAFLKDFDLYFSKLFNGMRHDSGCPYEWGRKFLGHYRSLKMDPMTKRMMFSDGLNLEKAVDLYKTFGNDALQGYGIGTDLTNDGNIKPLNLVMKMIRCNDQSVAKISDAPGKTLCEDETFIAYLKQVFKVV